MGIGNFCIVRKRQDKDSSSLEENQVRSILHLLSFNMCLFVCLLAFFNTCRSPNCDILNSCTVTASEDNLKPSLSNLDFHQVVQICFIYSLVLFL